MKTNSANPITPYTKQRFHQVVGDTVIAVRKERGMSQGEMARAAGLNQSTVQHAEAGVTISLLVLARIAEALDCTLDELVPLAALEDP